MPFVLANDFARPRSREPTALSRTIGDFRKPGRNRSVAKDDVERIPQLTGCMLASLLLTDGISDALLRTMRANGMPINPQESYSAASPTVSAIVAPRVPSGFGGPMVVSRAV
jgi:hypothetical protein